MFNKLSGSIFLLLFLHLGCSPPSSFDPIKKVEEVKITADSSSTAIDTFKRNPLLVSNDFGQTWLNASQGLPNDLQVSFLEKIGDEIIIATDNAALFISAENVSKWTQIGIDLPGRKINSLHIADEIIYAGVFKKGIFRSSDKGRSWQSLNYNLQNLSVQSIWVYDNELYAGTDIGISKYNPVLNSWQSLSIQAQVLSIYDFDNRLIAGTSKGTALSTDKGESWNWIRKEGAVHYTHNIGKRIAELSINGDLHFSDTWGKDWTAVQYAPREWSYIYEIITINDFYLLSNNYGIHRSIDEGKTWELIYQTEQMGFFDLLVKGNQIYGGTRVWDEFRKRNQ